MPSQRALVVSVLATAVAAGGLGYVARRPPRPETTFLNFDVESTPESVLDEGWSPFEARPSGDTFAWCMRKTCTIRLHVETPRDRIVRFRAFPFRYPGAPPQRAAIALDGTPVANVVLPDGDNVSSFGVRRALFHPGTNVLSFEFTYAESPKDHVPGSQDPRPLSAGFDWLELVIR